MALYALVDNNNIVTQVFVGSDEPIDGVNPETHYTKMYNQLCILTDVNGSIRKNYAGKGMIYDSQRDAFINPQPFPSWTLNEETCQWEAPSPEPDWTVPHFWNEDTLKWEIEPYFKNSITIESRVLTCSGCPFWDAEPAICTKCGCHGKALHTNPDAICPEGKW